MAFRSTRIHAPELTGRGGWINTNGKPLRLKDLRGRVVLLDFWTSACINCIHVMEELRALEQRYHSNQLAVVGIHSPKFEHESEHSAVVAAVERHGIEHPVLDDPELTTWSAYGVRAWPTIVVLDQEGYVAYVAAGERQLPALIKVIDRLLESKGHEHQSSGQSYEPDRHSVAKEIWYPSKLTRLMDGTILVANTGHHNVLQLAANGDEVLRTIGSGIRGAQDGSLEKAEFTEPTAVFSIAGKLMSKLPYDALVADRGNHALRAISLRDSNVTTFITGLASPWDIEYWPAIDRLVIAMAGRHVIAGLDLRSGQVTTIAGSGREGIRDGYASQAEFAQPSGLAAEPGPDGSLWVIDAETSALRRLRRAGNDILVETAIGRGLFDFGHRDGPANQALLQHPQGVSLGNYGDIFIADTFNGAVRKYDPLANQVSTVIDELQEPTDVLILDSALLIVESAANQITKIDLGTETDSMQKESLAPVRRTLTAVAPNLDIEITLNLPEPIHIDAGTENPTRITVTSTPVSLLSKGSGLGHDFERQLQLDQSVGSGTIHISATVASCDEATGICTLMTQDWNLHVLVKPDGMTKIKLVLSGPPPSDQFAEDASV